MNKIFIDCWAIANKHRDTFKICRHITNKKRFSHSFDYELTFKNYNIRINDKQ